VHPPSDFEAFRQSVADAVEQGDARAVRSVIHPSARTIAVEHGSAFRDLVRGLPTEIWHDDPRIAAAMGGSYRASGSPRGQSAIGYFVAAEDAIAGTDNVPAYCVVSVLVGHAAALRTHGRLGQARAKLAEAWQIMQSEPATPMPVRIEQGARWNLEHGIIDLHEGRFASARSHLEYAHGHADAHLTRAEHIECLGAIALAMGADGEYGPAREQIARARELAIGTDLLHAGYGAPAVLAELLISNECMQLERSAALEPEALEASLHNEWEPFAHVLVAQLRTLEDHPVVALDELNKASRGYASWEASGVGAQFSEVLRAGILMQLDHGDEAWAILRTMQPLENHMLCPARVTADLRLRHGDLVGAEEAIRECEHLGDAHGGRTIAEIYLLRAAIEFERGNFVVSDVSADRAFVRLARSGARLPLRRISGATLSAIADRAQQRRQQPDVERLLDLVSDHSRGEERQAQSLSARERLVLAQVQRGLTVAAIANELYISPNTVKTHLRRLYSKLGVSTRDEAIRAARALGLGDEITRDSPGSHHDSSEDAVL
jgi:DNA-binding NarL/FixJ family response regulator